MTTQQPPEQIADPVTAPAKPAPKPASKPEAAEPDAIPTGFPDPAAAGPDRPAAPDGKVRLATVPPMSELRVDDVVITEEGTDVDPDVAERAQAAARAAGLRLREL